MVKIMRKSFFTKTTLFWVVLFFLFSVSVTTAQVVVASSASNSNEPAPLYPIPLPKQVEWQKLEQYAFIHFGPNTFRNAEWGEGKPTEGRKFAPTTSSDIYTKQWVDELKKVGMNGIIFTAKHHDGFCLWQTKTTLHSLANKDYCGLKDDVFLDLSKNCHANGMNLGVYISPWDRSNWAYLSSDYAKMFKEQVREICSDYGDIFEIWFDGANGDSGWYGGNKSISWHKKNGAPNFPLLEDGNWDQTKSHSYYPANNRPNSLSTRKINPKKSSSYVTINNTVCKDIDEYIMALRHDAKAMIKELQPKALIFGEAQGEGIRWVGNEQGWAGRTNWSMGFNTSGDQNGTFWNPAECDMKTHKGWFFSTKEPSPKGGAAAYKNYIEYWYRSVGRNATLLLNFSPARDGKIPAFTLEQVAKFHKVISEDFAQNLVAYIDSVSASDTRGNDKKFSPLNLIDGNFDSYWATNDNEVSNASVTFNFKKPITFDRVVLQEYIPLGQRVKSFKIEYALNDSDFAPLEYPTMPHTIEGDSDDPDECTTIGYKRILRCYETIATKIKITFIENREAVPFVISEVGFYNSPNSRVIK